jgi:prepilin-type N-terminal cleavage/methylation domain-containing protein
MRPRNSRRGFSLPELLLVLVILGGLTAIALPPVRTLLDGIAVENGARQIRAAHFRARMHAVAFGRITLLDLGADTIRIRSVSGSDTVLAWQGAGPAADGLTLSGPAHPLIYSPLGLTMGVSNGTWHLTYGAASRDVIVSRLGRLRIQ